MYLEHNILYQKLVARHEREKKSDKDKYVTLYRPQPLSGNCAILYRSDSERYRDRPVHFHAWSIPPRQHGEAREYWLDDAYYRLVPFLELVMTGKDLKPSQAFSQYKVIDWPGFTAALGL